MAGGARFGGKSFEDDLSVAPRHVETESWMDRALKSVRLGLFGVLHVMNRDAATSWRSFLLLAAIDFVQMLDFAFNASGKLSIPWQGSVVQWFGRFTSFFKLSLEFVEAGTVFFPLFFCVVGVNIAVIVVVAAAGRSFLRNRFEHLWMLHFLRWWARFSLSVLYLPFQSILFSVFSCTARESDGVRAHSVDTTVECYTAFHTFAVVSGVVALVFQIGLSAIIALLFVDRDPLSVSPDAAPHGRIALYNVFVKAALNLAVAVVREDQVWILASVIVVAGTSQFLVQLFFLPFYDRRANQVVAGFSSVLAWATWCLVIALLETTSSTASTCFFGGLPVVAFAGYSMCDVRYKWLLRTSYSKLKSPLLVEVKLRHVLPLIGRKGRRDGDDSDDETTHSRLTPKPMGSSNRTRDDADDDDGMDISRSGEDQSLLSAAHGFDDVGTESARRASLRHLWEVDQRRGLCDPTEFSRHNLPWRVVEQVYRRAMRHFPRSTLLRMYVVVLLDRFSGDQDAAMQEVEQIERSRHAFFDEQFFAFARRRQATDTAIDQVTGVSRGGGLLDVGDDDAMAAAAKDPIHYITFEHHVNEAKRSAQAARMVQTAFWNELRGVTPDINKLFHLGGRLQRAVNRAHTHFKEVLKLNPSSPDMLRLYASFLLDVINDRWQADQLVKKADRVETARAKALAHSLAAAPDDQFTLADVQSEKLSLDPMDSRNAVITVQSGSGREVGRVLTVNDTGCRLTGYAKEELIGLNVSAIVPEPLASRHDTFIRDYEETKRGHVMGSTRPLFVRHASGCVIMVNFFLERSKAFAGAIDFGAAPQQAKATYVGVMQPVLDRSEYLLLDSQGTITGATLGGAAMLGLDLESSFSSPSILDILPEFFDGDFSSAAREDGGVFVELDIMLPHHYDPDRISLTDIMALQMFTDRCRSPFLAPAPGILDAVSAPKQSPVNARPARRHRMSRAQGGAGWGSDNELGTDATSDSEAFRQRALRKWTDSESAPGFPRSESAEPLDSSLSTSAHGSKHRRHSRRRPSGDSVGGRHRSMGAPAPSPTHMGSGNSSTPASGHRGSSRRSHGAHAVPRRAPSNDPHTFGSILSSPNARGWLNDRRYLTYANLTKEDATGLAQDGVVVDAIWRGVPMARRRVSVFVHVHEAAAKGIRAITVTLRPMEPLKPISSVRSPHDSAHRGRAGPLAARGGVPWTDDRSGFGSTGPVAGRRNRSLVRQPSSHGQSAGVPRGRRPTKSTGRVHLKRRSSVTGPLESVQQPSALASPVEAAASPHGARDLERHGSMPSSSPPSSQSTLLDRLRAGARRGAITVSLRNTAAGNGGRLPAGESKRWKRGEGGPHPQPRTSSFQSVSHGVAGSGARKSADSLEHVLPVASRLRARGSLLEGSYTSSMPRRKGGSTGENSVSASVISEMSDLNSVTAMSRAFGDDGSVASSVGSTGQRKGNSSVSVASNGLRWKGSSKPRAKKSSEKAAKMARLAVKLSTKTLRALRTAVEKLNGRRDPAVVRLDRAVTFGSVGLVLLCGAIVGALHYAIASEQAMVDAAVQQGERMSAVLGITSHCHALDVARRGLLTAYDNALLTNHTIPDLAGEISTLNTVQNSLADRFLGVAPIGLVEGVVISSGGNTTIVERETSVRPLAILTELLNRAERIITLRKEQLEDGRVDLFYVIRNVGKTFLEVLDAANEAAKDAVASASALVSMSVLVSTFVLLPAVLIAMAAVLVSAYIVEGAKDNVVTLFVDIPHKTTIRIYARCIAAREAHKQDLEKDKTLGLLAQDLGQTDDGEEMLRRREKRKLKKRKALEDAKAKAAIVSALAGPRAGHRDAHHDSFGVTEPSPNALSGPDSGSRSTESSDRSPSQMSDSQGGGVFAFPTETNDDGSDDSGSLASLLSDEREQYEEQALRHYASSRRRVGGRLPGSPFFWKKAASQGRASRDPSASYKPLAAKRRAASMRNRASPPRASTRGLLRRKTSLNTTMEWLGRGASVLDLSTSGGGAPRRFFVKSSGVLLRSTLRLIAIISAVALFAVGGLYVAWTASAQVRIMGTTTLLAVERAQVSRELQTHVRRLFETSPGGTPMDEATQAELFLLISDRANRLRRLQDILLYGDETGLEDTLSLGDEWTGETHAVLELQNACAFVPRERRAECSEFSFSVLRNGLQAGTRNHATNAERFAQSFPFPTAAEAWQSETFASLRRADAAFLDVLYLESAQLHAQDLRDRVHNRVVIVWAMYSVLVVSQVALHLLVGRTLIQELENDLKHARSMLLMIPGDVARKIPTIRQFVRGVVKEERARSLRGSKRKGSRRVYGGPQSARAGLLSKARDRIGL